MLGLDKEKKKKKEKQKYKKHSAILKIVPSIL